MFLNKINLFFSFCLLFVLIKTPVAQLKDSRVNSQASSPLLDFKTLSPLWLKQYSFIERKVNSAIQNLKSEVQKSAEELYKEVPQSALLPFKLHIKELKLFQPSNKDIVSIRMKAYVYSGGAHGGHRFYNWNWSKKKSKLLSFKEIVSTNPFLNLAIQARKKLFDIQIKRYPLEKQKEYANSIKKDILRGSSRLEHFRIWNLDKDEIVIIFPEYQVAPYSAGIFEIRLPLNQG